MPKKIPVEEAASLVPTLKPKDRQRLYDKVTKEFKDLSFFSEAEMNAILTNKKINDELRGYKEPSEATILSYQNDPKVVKLLVETVSKAFPLAHKFFKIKAKILKQKSLRYYDRNAKIADIKAKLTYEESKKTLLETFRKFDPKYSQILKSYLDNGQIDVYPRKGKTGGAFCSSSYENPTFVLLNHSENTRSFTTFAHEMGHAFHSELSRSQGPFYSDYSMSLAETASTFFEALAFDAMVEKLSEREKVIALHDKINNEISTIYRQVACFNYETEIHNILREKGFISKETLADLHNKHMKSYLGSAFKLEHDDGYFFVQWSHLRRFFYVYSYAYGLLVSKAMLKKYKEDNSFKDSIEKFLSAGGSDTPENILKSIGIDVSNPKFFQEGINEMANDISTLEKMIARK